METNQSFRRINRAGMKNILVLSICSMIAFASYFYAPNYRPRLPFQWLFLVLSITWTFMLPYTTRLSTIKPSIWISILGYAVSGLVNCYFGLHMGIYMVSEFIFQISKAQFLVSVSIYILETVKSQGVVITDNLERQATRAFGIFFFFYQMSSVVDNAIHSSHDKTEREMNVEIYVTFAVTVIAAIFLAILLDRIQCGSTTTIQNTSGNETNTIPYQKLWKQDKIFLLPLILWAGIQPFGLSFILVYLRAFRYNEEGTDDNSIRSLNLDLIIYGLINASVSLALGFLIKYTGRRVILCTAALINVIGLIVLIWISNSVPLFYISEGGPLKKNLLFAMMIFWGVANAIWNTQLTAFVGSLYPDKSLNTYSQFFGVMYSGHFIVWTTVQYILPDIFSCTRDLNILLTIFIVIIIFAVAGYLRMEYVELKNSKDSISTSSVAVAEELHEHKGSQMKSSLV